MARTAPTYPRNPVGGVYIKGARSIEASTGDTAITANGWIESEKYGWYGTTIATATSSEFDTAVTRTGTRTLKLSTMDATGRVKVTLGYNAPPPGTGDLTILKKYAVKLKPSTAYIFNCYCKTNNAVLTRIYLLPYPIGGGAGESGISTNTMTGTNDWTLLTKSFTSSATAEWYLISCYNYNAGNISDAWFDVSSLTLTQVLPRTAIASPRNPLGVARQPVV